MDRTTDGQHRFERPPLSMIDDCDRTITIETYAGQSEPLVEMYAQFDGTAQSQGVPPRTREHIRDWVETLLADGLSVVAVHEEQLVGHAVLFPYDDTSELAIFVHPSYQSAGIGTRLIRGLLGYGQANDIGHVWLTVSRDNRIALSLYRSAGFTVREDDRGELEMERPL